jgi:uncharacterized membrane protein YedE/YeeE
MGIIRQMCSRRWPPVLAGIVIGISMIAAFIAAGRGIGASGAMTRFGVTLQDLIFPSLTEKSAYFANYFAGGRNPLNDWLVYLMIGLLAGSFVAARLCGELRVETLRGPNISPAGRLGLALLGGLLVGFAARLARGCTCGQALVGGAELSVGGWAFMVCVFAGGYATAYFVRKQWI